MLLGRLIAQDMAEGRAVIVIEPKGDLVQDVLEHVPAHRRDDVVILDPSDPAPVGFNPLAVPGQLPEVVADGVLTRDMPRIRYEDLDPVAFWRTVSDSQGPTEWSFCPLNGRMRSLPKDLTEEEENRLVAAVDLQGQSHPFTKHRELHDEAMYLWGRGDLSGAVTSLQTAIESELFRVCFMLRLDEGATSDELDKWLAKDRYFKSLVTKDIPGKLGGAWNVTDGESPVGRYWRDLYEVRNRIVHSGLEPSYGQTVSAFSASDGLQAHLIDRLYANARKYPLTLLTLVGVEGLKRRGWMTPSCANG